MKKINDLYLQKIAHLLNNPNAHFIVCDFRGVDTIVQEFLKDKTTNVEIMHIGEHPRYKPDLYRTKVSAWKFTGFYKSDEERDLAAIEKCTSFLAYDFNSSNERMSGTMKNIIKCKKLGKIDRGNF